VALAAAALLGLPEQGPAWLSMVVWLALWGLYLSIVNVGQTFYGFGWETLLLEAGFLAVFLGPAATAPPTLVLWLYRWLLFRVEFGAGLIKLRGDRCWRDLTCLDYHSAGSSTTCRGRCTGPRCWPTTPPSCWCRSGCSPPSRWPGWPP
jgi:Lipase maturation factor